MTTRADPGCRRLRARQRACRMAMRRAGLYAPSGYTPPEGSGVERIWRLHGWAPSGRVAVVTVEIREAA